LDGLKKAIQESKNPNSYTELLASGESMSLQLIAAKNGESQGSPSVGSLPYATSAPTPVPTPVPVLPSSGTTAPGGTAYNACAPNTDDEIPTPPQLKVDMDSVSALRKFCLVYVFQHVPYSMIT
jgi:hypothetical protein